MIFYLWCAPSSASSARPFHSCVCVQTSHVDILCVHVLHIVYCCQSAADITRDAYLGWFVTCCTSTLCFICFIVFMHSSFVISMVLYLMLHRFSVTGSTFPFTQCFYLWLPYTSWICLGMIHGLVTCLGWLMGTSLPFEDCALLWAHRVCNKKWFNWLMNAFFDDGTSSGCQPSA